MRVRWPWTTVARLDDLREQVRYLREQNELLVDQIARIQRAQMGLPEVPRQPRTPQRPMPPEVQQYIRSIENPSIKREVAATLLRRHAAGTPWEAIQQDLRKSEGAIETATG